jgi:hypothetical protein
VFIIEYSSALKKKKILQKYATWMNLEDTMLREISHLRETNTLLLHLYMISNILGFAD